MRRYRIAFCNYFSRALNYFERRMSLIAGLLSDAKVQ